MKLIYSLRFIKMKKTFDRFKEVTTLYEEKSLGEDDIVIYKRFNDVTFSDEIKFFSFDNVEFINCKFERNIKNSVFHNRALHRFLFWEIMKGCKPFTNSKKNPAHYSAVLYEQILRKNKVGSGGKKYGHFI